MFTCTVATGLMVNSCYFMGFSIVGFMALLKEVKEQGLMEQGYIGIAVSGIICTIFIIS